MKIDNARLFSQINLFFYSSQARTPNSGTNSLVWRKGRIMYHLEIMEDIYNLES